MITSTIVVACRGVRRWFDLDAVRTPWAHDYNREDPTRKQASEYARQGHNGLGAVPRTIIADPAGAPPLDWHHDAPEPGVIVIGGPPDLERDDPIALAVKVIDCMCPRQVCRVCGVPRERIVESERFITQPPGKHAGVSRGIEGRKRPFGEHGRTERETLGWTDCGHNQWRRGRVFDPFGNPAIRAACELLDRDYVAVVDE